MLIRYEREKEEAFEVITPEVEPLSADFVSLGFDVVNKTNGPFFECSPLSCNGMAKEVRVNQFCLLETPEQAVAFARRCASEEPEPGPYYVLEVLGDQANLRGMIA